MAGLGEGDGDVDMVLMGEGMGMMFGRGCGITVCGGSWDMSMKILFVIYTGF